MDLSKESLLNLNWIDLAWFQHYNVQLNADTALHYFCQVGNPFYDPTCLNEQIMMNNASAEAMNNSIGIEYRLIHQQDPILFIIQKQYREGPGKPTRSLQEYYIIAPGHIYQAPDVATVISHRLLTTVHHFGKAFDEASQKAAYHPTSGYYWKTNGSSDEITKKDSSKEKILTQAQRARFDTIFPNYIERFRRIPPVVPANAAQSNSGSSMTTNDPSNGLATNDGNLPRKEERTPSDSQMNVTERPMMEIKKQKTQK